jgi:NitT/TauT family transport system permease protein
MKAFKAALDNNIAILAFLLAWEFMSRVGLFNTMFIPPFSAVLVTTWDLMVSGHLVQDILISLMRAITGFLVAAIVAIPLGFLLGGWFKNTQSALEPLFEMAAQANPFILFHVIILFLGIGEATKITIIAWICIWPILFNTASGVRNVDAVLLKSALSFGLGKWVVFYKIVLPAAAPAIFTGLRLSAGYSFFLLIVAEMMGSNSGLGWFVLYSQENYNIQWIFSGAMLIGGLGLSIDLLVQYIEKKVIIWEVEERVE